MVMPTPLMEELYEVLLTTELEIIATLKTGIPICEAFEKGLNHFKKQKPDYVQYLIKSSFGYVIINYFRSLCIIFKSIYF